MSGKISVRKVLVNATFLMLLFISCLPKLSDNRLFSMLLNYIDELLVLLLWIYLVLNYKAIKLKKNNIAVLWILIMLIGLLSSMTFGYQPIQAILIESIAICSRFLVGYLATTVYIYGSKKALTPLIEKTAKGTTWILFMIALHDVFFDPFYSKADYRLFMNSLQLMFTHPTYLAATACTLLIYFGYANRRKNYYGYMILCTIIAIVTFRGKALGFVAVYWVLYICLFVLKIRNIRMPIVFGGVIAMVVAWDKIREYYLIPDRFSPRAILLKDSIKLMIQHFPLGTGFASFGGNIAAKYYSPLYTSFGYGEYRGMNPADTSFLSDSFWPTIFAQFGFVGTIIFVCILLLMLKYALQCLKKNKYAGLAMLSTLLFLLITSLGETAFFNPTAFLLFILFACYEQEYKLECDDKGATVCP